MKFHNVIEEIETLQADNKVDEWVLKEIISLFYKISPKDFEDISPDTRYAVLKDKDGHMRLAVYHFEKGTL